MCALPSLNVQLHFTLCNLEKSACAVLWGCMVRIAFGTSMINPILPHANVSVVGQRLYNTLIRLCGNEFSQCIDLLFVFVRHIRSWDSRREGAIAPRIRMRTALELVFVFRTLFGQQIIRLGIRHFCVFVLFQLPMRLCKVYVCTIPRRQS